LALLSLAGLTKVSLSSSKPERNDSRKQPGSVPGKLQCRVLGKTGIKLPVVSMGVMNANNPGLLKGAWDSGIRHFDTAWNYQNGNNEKMVGSILRELNVNRGEVTISTKTLLPGPITGKNAKELFLARFNESLTRLQMDYVDILYYHMPQGLEQINDPYILEAFNELKEKKKIRFTGFSTHTDWPEVVTDAANRKFYDVILLSYNYAMYNDQRVFEALKMAHESGIGLVAMKTQCRQGWYKMNLPAELQKYYSENNMNTALLKWALKNEHITTAIPGFTSFDQLNEDIAVAYDLTYTKEEEEFLKNKDVKLAIQSVCRQCGQCVSSCPRNVDIPNLMRTHMYSLSYGNPLMAKQTLAQIQTGRGLDICNNCGKCISRCQYRVPVASRIKELVEIYC
jgi:predicted aldo/keto reductase-like oxidoreductase